MPAPESTGKNFAVTAAVAAVCSLAVSFTAVGLRARREGNQDLERMKHILTVAGLYDPNVPVTRSFTRVEPRLVDLETGAYASEDEFDPTAAVVIPSDDDVAGVEKRERYVRVYLVRDIGRVTQIILPVRGEGWSMLHGFVALDRDLVTVRGFTVYRHEETAGLGAEVDNPKWKARWPGKRIFDAEGKLRFRVAKGAVDAASPEAAYEVDGLSGATLTSEGIGNLMRFWFGDYGFRRYLERLAEKGVDHD